MQQRRAASHKRALLVPQRMPTPERPINALIATMTVLWRGMLLAGFLSCRGAAADSAACQHAAAPGPMQLDRPQLARGSKRSNNRYHLQPWKQQQLNGVAAAPWAVSAEPALQAATSEGIA